MLEQASFAIAVLILLVSIATFVFIDPEKHRRLRYGLGLFFLSLTFLFVMLGIFSLDAESDGAAAQEPAADTVPGDQTSPQLETISFEVAADRRWQETAVIIQAGEQFSVEFVSGEITDLNTIVSDGRGVGYACNSSDCCEPMPFEGRSALIGKVGGELFYIGNGGTFTAETTGPLELRINDCDAGLEDNAGSLKVNITHYIELLG